MDNTELKTLSINFLICCYFGQAENLGQAAIDSAYVDMASQFGMVRHYLTLTFKTCSPESHYRFQGCVCL